MSWSVALLDDADYDNTAAYLSRTIVSRHTNSKAMLSTDSMQGHSGLTFFGILARLGLSRPGRHAAAALCP
jgi:hypothetical protein